MTVCGAARRAGARHVLIPRTAAVFSAFGIGFSDLGQRYEEPLPAVDYATISDVADRLLALGAGDMFAEGVDASACTARFRLTVGHQDEERVIELDDLQDATTHLTPGDRASLELVLQHELQGCPVARGQVGRGILGIMELDDPFLVLVVDRQPEPGARSRRHPARNCPGPERDPVRATWEIVA